MKIFNHRSERYILSAIIVILSAVTLWTTPKNETQSENLKVAFLDVGQGDCSLISIEDKAFLIDGGEYEYWNDDIKPYMLENGINMFSWVMASHYHSDHGGGILELINDGKANRLIIPDTEDKGTLKSRLLKSASKFPIDFELISAGSALDMEHPDVKLEVLFPDGAEYENIDRNINNDSIVFRLDYFNTSLLFTGDLESDAEAVLLNSGRLDADILKVGHHGSSTSSSKEFLEAVSPDYAIIQAGENNSYGHPHEKVVDRIRKLDTMIYRTDRDGDIVFEINEKGILNIETEY